MAGQGHGQDKVYEVTNPQTGEKRTVTQREWREQKLGRAGFQKPDDMPEDEAGDTGEQQQA